MTNYIFGDRWSLLIIRDLLFMEKQYYGDFLNSTEKISTNILANRLEKLEVDGLITKKVDAKNRSKKIYRLTEKGLDLLPMLLEMIVWSAKYDKQTLAPKKFIEQIQTDRDDFMQEIRRKLNVL
ncbi:MAG: helix-turn-helix domain-containing protein [Gammaproteobacteria bacterium]|nr:helix-turn-helix domain-containing protein [Gammaproteobacteria bacterium]